MGRRSRTTSSSSRRSSATPRTTSPRTRTFWRCRSASRRWATKFSYTPVYGIPKTGRRNSRRGASRVFRHSGRRLHGWHVLAVTAGHHTVVKNLRGLLNRLLRLEFPLARGAWIPGDPRVFVLPTFVRRLCVCSARPTRARFRQSFSRDGAHGSTDDAYIPFSH